MHSFEKEATDKGKNDIIHLEGVAIHIVLDLHVTSAQYFLHFKMTTVLRNLRKPAPGRVFTGMR